jgi:hypothetical protein
MRYISCYSQYCKLTFCAWLGNKIFHFTFALPFQRNGHAEHLIEGFQVVFDIAEADFAAALNILFCFG